MTNLIENPVYETGVFRLETTTPVKGGEPVFVAGEPTDGFANAQAQQLANRTAYLKDQVDGVPQQIADSITQLKGEVDPFPQYPLETELGSAAFTSAANYATSAQGDKADTAVQPDELINYEKVLTAGANITIDRTDPNSPVISASASSGMTNPMTTIGDMVKAGVGGVAERLPIGTDGQVLTVSSGSPAWVDLSSSGGDVSGPASSVNNDVALFDGTTGKVIKSGGQLGSAAFTDSTAYATSSQGGLADTALQPDDIGVSVQAQLVSGTNIKTINGESILGSGDIVVSGGGGGVTWSLISASGNVVGGGGYIVDNTTAGIILTLPSSPSAQASIRFTSLKNTNSWQIDPLTENINGVAGVMTVDIFGGFELVYINSAVGWVVV